MLCDEKRQLFCRFGGKIMTEGCIFPVQIFRKTEIQEKGCDVFEK